MYPHKTICLKYVSGNATSLWFNHHSAVNDWHRPRPHIIRLWTRQTWPVATVIPPTSRFQCSTVVDSVVVILVICRKLHPVVVVEAKLSITNPVILILERITGISAVSSHFQSILVIEPITDLERPVLGWVPEVRWSILHLDPQTVGLWTG